MAKKCTRHLRPSKFGAIAGDYVTVRSMAFCGHRSIILWKTRENRHSLGFQLPLLPPPMPLLFLSTPASCCTLPVAPTTSTRSSVRSSNSGGFGSQRGQISKVLDSPSPPSRTLVLPPPKRTQKSVQNYGAKMDRSSGTNWPSGPFFSKKKNGFNSFRFLEPRFPLL